MSDDATTPVGGGLDTDLLDTVLDIVSHPEKMPEGTGWYQGDWVRPSRLIWKETADGSVRAGMCGTSMCFAGWVVYLDGYTEYDHGTAVSAMVNPTTGLGVRYSRIRDYAKDRLGLTESQADDLFDADNDLEDLVTEIGFIKEGTTRSDINQDDDEWDQYPDDE